MPAPPNPSFLSNSPLFIDVIKGVLLSFCSSVLKDETPIAPSAAGYLAYSKRTAYARQCGLNADAEAKRAAFYIAVMKPDVVINDEATFTYYTTGNPSGKNVFSCAFDPTGPGFSAAVEIGQQIFDTLAGVSRADLS